MKDETQRDAAIITFLATVSGMHFLGFSFGFLGNLYWHDRTLDFNSTTIKGYHFNSSTRLNAKSINQHIHLTINIKSHAVRWDFYVITRSGI